MSYYVLILLAGYWLLRLAVHWWVRGWRRRRFLIAPAGAVIVGALLHFDVAFEARWAISEGAFSKAAVAIGPAPAGEQWVEVEVPKRIGAYRTHGAHQVPGGVIFEAAFDCDLGSPAGFGWFPAGAPDPARLDRVDEFQRPSFRHLGGDWYSWCAQGF